MLYQPCMYLLYMYSCLHLALRPHGMCPEAVPGSAKHADAHICASHIGFRQQPACPEADLVSCSCLCCTCALLHHIHMCIIVNYNPKASHLSVLHQNQCSQRNTRSWETGGREGENSWTTYQVAANWTRDPVSLLDHLVSEPTGFPRLPPALRLLPLHPLFHLQPLLLVVGLHQFTRQI